MGRRGCEPVTCTPTVTVVSRLGLFYGRAVCEQSNRVIGGEFHVNDSARRPGVAVGRSIAIVAIQQILGLLPNWRCGASSSNRIGPTADGPSLKSKMCPFNVDGGSASSHHFLV